jgi:hypothetical protein
MGLITFKLKTGAQIAINTTNIVSIERRDNYVIILYNVAFNRGLLKCMKGRLHSDKYEYKSSDEAIEAFNIMCSMCGNDNNHTNASPNIQECNGKAC